jgi:hypothetical protein
VPDEREQVSEEEQKRLEKLYLAYIAALMAGLDDFDARNEQEWEAAFESMNADADKTRKQLLKAVREYAPKIEAADDPAPAWLDLQVAAGAAIWAWQEQQAAALGLKLAPTRGMPPLGTPVAGTVEVNNRRWVVGGAAVDGVAAAKADALDSLESAGKALKSKVPEVGEFARQAKKLPVQHQGKSLGRPPAAKGKAYAALRGEDLEGVIARAEELADQHGGNVESWVENVVRNFDYYSHQALNPFVDAMAASAVADDLEAAAVGFAPPENALRLSFQTHARAAVRSTMKAAGDAMEAKHYMYYPPQAARAIAEPAGFAAEHGYQIRTTEEWAKVREALDQKRPGSFMFSTGFHVGDRGTLVPIPLALLAAAYEIERKRRQKWLEKQRAKAEQAA